MQWDGIEPRHHEHFLSLNFCDNVVHHVPILFLVEKSLKCGRLLMITVCLLYLHYRNVGFEPYLKKKTSFNLEPEEGPVRRRGWGTSGGRRTRR